MNRANLYQLAKFLWDNRDRVSQSFEMSTFCGTGRGCVSTLDMHKAPTLHACKTVGCAVGWGPAAGLPPQIDETTRALEKWSKYASRVFDLNPYEFSWCFGGDWAVFDNTVVGAVKRILLLLKNGTPSPPLYPGSEARRSYQDFPVTQELWTELEGTL